MEMALAVVLKAPAEAVNNKMQDCHNSVINGCYKGMLE